MSAIGLVLSAFGLLIAAAGLAFGILKWVAKTRKEDMTEIRALSANDMTEVRNLRNTDMGEIRGAMKENRETLKEIGSSIVRLTDRIATQNSRVGKIEEWKESHQATSEKGFAEIEDIRSTQQEHGRDLAVLKARSQDG